MISYSNSSSAENADTTRLRAVIDSCVSLPERTWEPLENGVIPVFRFAIDLSGRLDTAVLQKAIHAVVDRHKSLRTILKPAGCIPRVVILDNTTEPVLKVDEGLANLPAFVNSSFAPGDSFDAVIAPLDRKTFLENVWNRRFFRQAGSSDRFSHLLSIR